MEYSVFTTNLKLTRFAPRLKVVEKDEEFWKAHSVVNGDYDKHRDYGFWEGDDENAVLDALIAIELYKDDMEREDQSLLEEYRKFLVKDLKNYLYCISCGLRDNLEYLEELFEGVAAIGLADVLAGIIEDYYNTNFNQKQEIDWEEPLDFKKLYINIGDHALFEKQDIELALQFYNLAALNWENEEVDKENQRIGRRWRYNCMFYESIIRSTINKESILHSPRLKSNVKVMYAELMRLWEAEASCSDIVKATDRFFAEFNSVIFAKATTFERIRDLTVLAHVIKNNGILPALYCLEDEDEETRLALKEGVIECVEISQVKKLQLLKEYALEKKGISGVFENILRFARSMVYVDDIKRLLRVQEIKQDMGYYTGLETFGYMLPIDERKDEEVGHLSVMNIAYMNDPNEGKILKKYLGYGDAGTAMRERKSVRYPYVFMKCFTSLIDDLPMWEMYGDHAKGCCLILDWKETIRGIKPGEEVPLYRICYLKKKGNGYSYSKECNPDVVSGEQLEYLLMQLQRIAKELKRKTILRKIFYKIVEEITYLFKDSDYQHERELRIIYSYSKHSSEFCYTAGKYPKLFVRPDFPMKLKEIILGPKFENISERVPYIQERVEIMCEKIGAEVPKMTLSDIDYK